MMGFRTLGLDLGVASIGWAYIEESGDGGKLLGWGSRIFEAGMDDDIAKGKGTSRCAERRAQRAARIMLRRRRNRKNQLIETLTRYGLLPEQLTSEFFVRQDRELLKGFPANQRRQVAQVLPYILRARALDQKLSPYELGRALFHLAQRRGYKSNRKQELKDAEAGVVKASINELQQEMAATQARTLGEYFSTLDPEKTKVRRRYTDRAMFEAEFHQICQAQRQLISAEQEKELYRVIFFQLPLRSCKNLVRRCRLYPEERGCSYLREEAQLFRIYTTVKNLRIEHQKHYRKLTAEEWSRAIAFLNGFSGEFTRSGTITLNKLGKALGLGKGEKFTLGEDEKEIYGNALHAQLYQVFGERAQELSEAEREKFFQDLTSIEKSEVLEKRLQNYWQLDAEQQKIALKIAPPDEYCAFSLKALKELLPDLAAGIDLSTRLKTDYQGKVRIFSELPPVDAPESGLELRNPLVHRVLSELRYVVNALIRRYGKPDRIQIELARDLKSSNKERELYTRRTALREKERQAIAEKIVQEAGIAHPSRNDILKVMLAEECDFTCPYTGKHFSMTDLLHGKDIHIEHILPYSRSFDDSFANKTLCEASCNAEKNNRTPYEAFSGERYQAMLARVKNFKGEFASRKLELFKLEKFEPEDFLARNLNDTRYASKLAMQYLALLYGGVIDGRNKRMIFATSGRCTALVRRAWGGNYLLGEGEKTRADHRHHAIDALTIALTTPDIVQKIAQMPETVRRKLRDEQQPLLDNWIYQAAQAQLDQAAVSHHVINKLRGPFHKETIYGKGRGDTGKTRHVRRALAEIEPGELPEIVDPVIKKLVADKLDVTVENLGKVSPKALKIFQEPDNLPVLTDRHGNLVNTISKVRVAKNFDAFTIGAGDSQRAVMNKVNYLLAIYARLNSAGEEIAWEGEVVNLLNARQRFLLGQPLFEINKPGLKFKFTLKKGDIVQWIKNGKEQLCVIRGISLPVFFCVPINDARKQKDLKSAKVWYTPTLSAAFSGGMKKYRMNIFGELRDAND